MLLFWLVSIPYVSNSFTTKDKRFPLILLTVVLFSAMLPMITYVAYHMVAHNTGGLAPALGCFIPVLYFYKYNQLPTFIEDNIISSLSIFFVMAYLGTQVLIVGQFFIWFVIYLCLRKLLPTRFEAGQFNWKQHKVLLSFVVFYLVHVLFSLMRNSVFGTQFEARKAVVSFDMNQLYQRVTQHPFFCDLSIILG
ncbi:MAG: hypothetical protein ACRCY4_07690, partial [Brevinema sp.]